MPRTCGIFILRHFVAIANAFIVTAVATVAVIVVVAAITVLT